jgi:uncharacterized protein (TIGR02118 family)
VAAAKIQLAGGECEEFNSLRFTDRLSLQLAWTHRVAGNEKELKVPTKITIIYDNPVDPAVFEGKYPAQLVLAKAIPGLQRVESAKVWPKEDGTPTPAYRTIELYFDDYDKASEAVTTPEAGVFFPSIFELATGGVRILFSNIEES